MKTPLLIFVSLAAVSGCSFAARSPEMYRDDTKAVLEKKNDAIRACYDGVLKSTPTAQGRVTVKFDVAEDTGKIGNVTVDRTQTTAPDPVSDCVVKNIDGLTIDPPDQRKGEAMWVYDFAAPPPGKT